VLDNEEGIVKLAAARVGSIPITEAPVSQGVLATIQMKVADDAPPVPSVMTLEFVGLADGNFNDILGIILQDGSVTIIP
jgi:hypothetical protein